VRIVAVLVAAAILLAGPGCRFGGGSDEAGIITGYVYDDATGEPIAGALVVVKPLGTSIRSGTDGSYRFDDLPRGKFTLQASADGFLDAEVKGISVSPGKTKWAKLFLKRQSGAEE